MEGKFKVYNSIGLQDRNEFYLLGNILEGDIKIDYYAHIPFNFSFSLSSKIVSIEKVLVDEDSFLLIGLNCKDEAQKEFETFNLLTSLAIKQEIITISKEGED